MKKKKRRSMIRKRLKRKKARRLANEQRQRVSLVFEK